jgi:hypothetical protein
MQLAGLAGAFLFELRLVLVGEESFGLRCGVRV